MCLICFVAAKRCHHFLTELTTWKRRGVGRVSTGPRPPPISNTSTARFSSCLQAFWEQKLEQRISAYFNSMMTGRSQLLNFNREHNRLQRDSPGLKKGLQRDSPGLKKG